MVHAGAPPVPASHCLHMKKVKYYYNTRTLRYEKLVIPLWIKLLRVLGFLSAAAVTSFLIVLLAYRFFDSPNEKRLRQELAEMQDRYRALEDQMGTVNQQLLALQHRDNDIYRVIFEAKPLPDSIRAGKLLRDEEYALFSGLDNQRLIHHANLTMQTLENRIRSQRQSYGVIEDLMRDKQKMLAHIPAIQPVSNRDLTRIASGFGYRIDPIYKTMKYHTGLDFAAPRGTPVYATGDGVVDFAGENGDGYGKHVILDHGYGYQSLYGHLFRTKVRRGQRVKRGEVIGWVGSTGKSTGPHCHYEVIKNGDKLDPVYFFYNDLTPEQYERMLRIASTNNQSLD